MARDVENPDRKEVEFEDGVPVPTCVIRGCDEPVDDGIYCEDHGLFSDPEVPPP